MIVIMCIVMLGIIISSAVLEGTDGVSVIGLILLLAFLGFLLCINNELITTKAEQQTYHKALIHNPYEMTILYDALNNPRDTIYELKEIKL